MLKYQEFQEASYAGNLGVMELIHFNKKASNEQKQRLKQHIQNKEHEKMRNLVKDVTGVKLHQIVKEIVKPDILPKAGAGQWGTDELNKTYIKDTPGQNYAKFKQYIK